MLGFGAMVLSLLLFSLMDASVKWLGATYATSQIMFFRCAVAMVPVLTLVALRGGPAILKTRQIKWHALRSLLGISAMALAFYAFSLMPLAEAVSLMHTGPLFMTALSVILLREKVGVRRWSAVMIGFCGMLIVMRPGSDMFASGSIYMLGAAFLIACTTIIIRFLNRYDDPVCITFYFTFTGVVASSIGVSLQGWIVPAAFDLGLLCAVGILGGLAQFLMTLCYRYVAVGTVAPLKYLTIAFGGLIGYLVWKEIPDLQSVVGIAIIIASGLYTLHRELLLKTRTSDE